MAAERNEATREIADISDIQRETQLDFTQKDRLAVLTRDGFRCRYCGASARSGATLHVDHIWPAKFGGLPLPVNGQVLCEACNQAKGQKVDAHKIADGVLSNSIAAYASRAPAPTRSQLPHWWKSALKEGLDYLETISQELSRRSTFRIR